MCSQSTCNILFAEQQCTTTCYLLLVAQSTLMTGHWPIQLHIIRFKCIVIETNALSGDVIKGNNAFFFFAISLKFLFVNSIFWQFISLLSDKSLPIKLHGGQYQRAVVHIWHIITQSCFSPHINKIFFLFIWIQLSSQETV